MKLEEVHRCTIVNKSCLTLLGNVLFAFLFAFSTSADIQYAGVNLSGAEFGDVIASGGKLPGTYGINYIYPNNTETDYYQSRGMNIHPAAVPLGTIAAHQQCGTFNSTNLGRMVAFVNYATSHGMYVMLDPHNFMRYYPNPRSGTQNATNGLVGTPSRFIPCRTLTSPISGIRWRRFIKPTICYFRS